MNEIGKAFWGIPADAFIILTIVFPIGLLVFWQERRAAKAAVKLLDVMQTTEIRELAH
jgi:ABC-type proline/glycine betaine transport system permease subunit